MKPSSRPSNRPSRLRPHRRTNWRRRIWVPAVEASIGAPLRFHDLRHSPAAMLIAQGEHVKVMADRPGHANPIVTMTTYAHLFDGLDVAAAERLDEAWVHSVTDPRWTQAVSSPIPMTPRHAETPVCQEFREQLAPRVAVGATGFEPVTSAV